uniref:Serpin 3 n=1 Tax=Fasciola hepatica TaxID=6192 RepID=A0A7D5ZZ66_FASHE|nr:serpin 3 [Fasciola hepatica]
MTSSMEHSLKSFCDKLYGEAILSQKGNYENVFLSPMSLYSVMAMVLAGGEGETKEQMLTALQLNRTLGRDALHNSIGSAVRVCLKSSPGVTVSFGNRIYAQHDASILPQYKAIVLGDYDADVENVDFTKTEAARKDINQWVSEKTKEKIRELIPSGVLGPDTCVAIINALYFKGSWEIEFPKEATTKDKFHLLDGGRKEVFMMYKESEFHSTVLAELDSVAVKLPFRQSKWEMFVIVPNKKDGLKSLLPKLQSEGLTKALSASFTKQTTGVFLPRFKLTESTVDAKELLTKLGMSSVFSRTTADLSKMCSSRSLFISDIKHKAILEVDEEGAEAVAASAAIAVPMCLVIPEIRVKADHPFVVALVYDDKIPIFVGHVTDPEVN